MKNVRKRKKKKINRYILYHFCQWTSDCLDGSGVISWAFLPARRTYTVVILKEGAGRSMHNTILSAAGKGRMPTQTKRAEKQNAGIRYDHKPIAIGYGVSCHNFKERINAQHLPPWRAETEEQAIQTAVMK